MLRKREPYRPLRVRFVRKDSCTKVFRYLGLDSAFLDSKLSTNLMTPYTAA